MSERQYWHVAIIASTKNLKNIGRYRQIRGPIALVVKAMTEGNLPSL